MSRSTQNLIGKRIGRLLVTKKLGKINRNMTWECLCDCGNFKILSTRIINQGRTNSCGCLRKDRNRESISLLNKRFGHLLVIDYAENINKIKTWKCLCDCGNIKIAKGTSLRYGDTQSCGCLQRRQNSQNPNWKGFGEISLYYWNRIKKVAKKRGLEFTISIEEGWNLFLEQDRLCKLTKTLLLFKYSYKIGEFTASLDRIDSSKGYTIDNVQWVHKDINRMKGPLSMNQLIYWSKLVLNKDDSEYTLIVHDIKDNRPTGVGLLNSQKWGSIKHGAKNRKIEFNISREQIWELFIKQNGRCAITNTPIILGEKNTASLDRIDSSKGYTIDNVWWVHADINRMKFIFSVDEFINICKKILDNCELKK